MENFIYKVSAFLIRYTIGLKRQWWIPIFLAVLICGCNSNPKELISEKKENLKSAISERKTKSENENKEVRDPNAFFSTEKRIVKKFFKRLSAREPAKAAQYVYDDDQVNVYIFNKRFLRNNKTVGFEIIEMTKTSLDGEIAVITKIKGHNLTESLKNYFSDRGLISENIIIDTLYVRIVQDKKKISFEWDWDSSFASKDLVLANSTTENGKLNIRSGPGENYKIIGKIKNNWESILIDNSYNNNSWRKCILFNEDGTVNYGYVSAAYTKLDNKYFINLGWMGKLGGLVASILGIVVLIIVYPLLITTIFRAAEDSATFGLILFGVLILVIIFTYTLVEGMLFDLFFINLPF